MAENKQGKVYTSVEDINYHLSNVFALYPTLYAARDKKDYYLQVVAPLIKNSREFCENIKNKNIVLGDATGAGGFSQAGQLNIMLNGNKNIPMASGISFAPDGSWKNYFMQTFAKTSHDTVPIKIQVEKTNLNVDVIIGSDPVNEGLIGALVSHLFDLGVAPSFMKYLGLYLCDDTYRYTGESDISIPVSLAKPYFLFEKSDMEMMRFIGGEQENERKSEKAFLDTTPYDFMIWNIQIAHSVFVGKYYFGITHIDLHTSNMMLTHVKQGGGTIKMPDHPVTPLMYSKVDLNKAGYYEYVMPFKVDSSGKIVDDLNENGIEARIIVENNGFLPKIIDFGLSIAELNKSVVARDQNIIFANELGTYDKPVMGYEAIKQDKKGDTEYNFFTLNVLYRIARAIRNDGVGYQNAKLHYQKLWSGLLGFWKATLPAQFSPENIENGGAFISAKDGSGRDVGMKIFSEFGSERASRGAYHMRARAVGTTSNIESPLRKIWQYMVNTPMQNDIPRLDIFKEKSGDVAIIQVTRDNIKHIILEPENIVKVPYRADQRFSNLQKFINYNFALWRACIPYGKNISQAEINYVASKIDSKLVGKNSLNVCQNIISEIQKYDPNNKKKLEFFKNIINPELKIWDKNKKTLISGITRQMLEDSGLQRSKTRHTQLFTLRFNPGELEMGAIANKEFFKFSSDQRLTNYKPPENPGEYMKMVNVHLLYISQPPGEDSGFAITAEKNKTLFKASKEMLSTSRSGVSINGGYFIVPGNYQDPLNYSISSSDRGKPIGFFYSETTPEFNGTVLPIPAAYQKDFCTIYVRRGKLFIESSNVFRSRHKTFKTTTLYSLNRAVPSTYASEVENIDMKYTNGMLRPVIKDPNFEYSSAFECGPILIWKGEIKFTREKMKKSMFQINAFRDVPAENKPNLQPNIFAEFLEPYKVVTSAQNSKMYFNEPMENSFPYGQRHSNSLMIHNVLCQTRNGDILVFFVEGRGFDSVGLDRAQLSELISRFNVVTAVSLDGGFSANAVLKRPNADDMGYYWLLNDPEKRELSTMIHFSDGI